MVRRVHIHIPALPKQRVLKDAHAEKALELFGVVTPETRQKAKLINYQTMYRKDVS